MNFIKLVPFRSKQKPLCRMGAIDIIIAIGRHHGKKENLTIKEVAMIISRAITIFMDYQKMNSGKKYG